jgi:hypothetical protein
VSVASVAHRYGVAREANVSLQLSPDWLSPDRLSSNRRPWFAMNSSSGTCPLSLGIALGD